MSLYHLWLLHTYSHHVHPPFYGNYDFYLISCLCKNVSTSIIRQMWQEWWNQVNDVPSWSSFSGVAACHCVFLCRLMVRPPNDLFWISNASASSVALSMCDTELIWFCFSWLHLLECVCVTFACNWLGCDSYWSENGRHEYSIQAGMKKKEHCVAFFSFSFESIYSLLFIHSYIAIDHDKS